MKRALVATLAALSFVSPALAQEAAPTVIDEQFIGPLPAPADNADLELEEVSLIDAVEEPAAPEQGRTWLKEEAATPVAPSSGNSGLSAVALVLLLGLGGAALYFRQRRGQSKEVRVASSLRVLSQVRVGPKANLVTVAVSGRVLLLGVTETSVSNLGFVSDGDGAPDAAALDAGDNVLPLQRGSVSVPKKRFEQELEASLSRANWTANPEVASLLVDRSEDVVMATRSARAPSPAPEAPKETRIARVEDQVLGLLRRRKS